MKRLLVATLGGALALTLGATLTQTASAAPANPVAKHDHGSKKSKLPLHQAAKYTPPKLQWGACEDPRLKAAGAECTMVTVPLDYGQPWGKTIKLAVSRIKATVPNSAYQGVMLVNPGGPGGSGLSLARLGAYVPKNAGAAYDWIGFDPRGVGSSEPSLSCDGNYFGYNRPDYVPTTEAIEKTWRKKAKGYAKKCDKAGGALLEHTKSTDWAMDMDQIRKALGADQINYYGFSYGTYLGQVYSTLYPKKVRRMVWDGVVNPDNVWYDANLDQDTAFDKNMDIYFDWIAEHDSVYHLGDKGYAVKGLYYSKLDDLREAPEAGGKLGPDEWTDAFLSAGYYVFGWEGLAEAFAAAINDDNWAPMLAAYDGANGAGPGSDNTYAVYNAVQCTDTQWPTKWKQWQSDNWRTYGMAPFETWANAWYNTPCFTWGASAGTPLPINGKKVPPILLISETNDAATPYAGALRVRDIYPKSVLIEGVDGTTHAGSLSGIACTDDKIADYLLTGELPARTGGDQSDVQCDPVPEPDPSAGFAPKKQSGKQLPADLREVITSAQR